MVGSPKVALLPEETIGTFFAVQVEIPDVFRLFFGFILILECILMGQDDENHGLVLLFKCNANRGLSYVYKMKKTSRFLIFKMPRSQYLVFDYLSAKTSANFIKPN